MASGVAVVTTRCFGNAMFCEHNVNCLMAPIGDAHALSVHVAAALSDPALNARLVVEGRRTAERWGALAASDALEVALHRTHSFFGAHARPPVLAPTAYALSPPIQSLTSCESCAAEGDAEGGAAGHGGPCDIIAEQGEVCISAACDDYYKHY